MATANDEEARNLLIAANEEAARIVAAGNEQEAREENARLLDTQLAAVISESTKKEYKRLMGPRLHQWASQTGRASDVFKPIADGATPTFKDINTEYFFENQNMILTQFIAWYSRKGVSRGEYRSPNGQSQARSAIVWYLGEFDLSLQGTTNKSLQKVRSYLPIPHVFFYN
jgi:hypothetical protein